VVHQFNLLLHQLSVVKTHGSLQSSKNSRAFSTDTPLYHNIQAQNSWATQLSMYVFILQGQTVVSYDLFLPKVTFIKSIENVKQQQV
jgi:hypothetical protein